MVINRSGDAVAGWAAARGARRPDGGSESINICET